MLNDKVDIYIPLFPLAVRSQRKASSFDDNKVDELRRQKVIPYYWV